MPHFLRQFLITPVHSTQRDTRGGGVCLQIWFTSYTPHCVRYSPAIFPHSEHHHNTRCACQHTSHMMVIHPCHYGSLGSQHFNTLRANWACAHVSAHDAQPSLWFAPLCTNPMYRGYSHIRWLSWLEDPCCHSSKSNAHQHAVQLAIVQCNRSRECLQASECHVCDTHWLIQDTKAPAATHPLNPLNPAHSCDHAPCPMPHGTRKVQEVQRHGMREQT